MKTTKVVLPMIAVLFATVGALATTNVKSSFAPKQVRIVQEDCPLAGTCSNDNPSVSCTRPSDSAQLWERISDISCSVAANGTFTPK